jgi:hypothetical protein
MQSRLLGDEEERARGVTSLRGGACTLCGQTRRMYLFVVGRSRVTRCEECLLVSRVDEEPRRDEPDSYVLDSDSEAKVRSWIAGDGGRRRVLQVVDGDDPRARLRPDPRLDVVTTSSQRVASALEPDAFDAVFVNAAVEHTAPLALMRRLRTAVRRGGDLVVLAGATLQMDQSTIPSFVLSPAPLTRLVLASGFRPRSCGMLFRKIETAVPDERLADRLPFASGLRWLERAGRPVEVRSGLLAIHAQAEAAPERQTLSIIMPVFNEAATFRDTFESVYAARIEKVDREIVIVESNSTDGSRELVREAATRPGVRALFEDRPRGKGCAVRAGIAASTGDLILIQDADSEYDVGDYDIVLGPLLNLSATFVLGSRHLGGRTWKIRQFTDRQSLSYVMNLAHEAFTLLTNSLYGTAMRDPTTMYKAFRRDAYDGIDFRRERFDFDFELVCKLVRRGHIPIEVPVNYRSRSYAEGKKVRFFRDPITWVETIVQSRFEPMDG